MSASFMAAVRAAIEEAVSVSTETIADILEGAAREQRRISAWSDPLRITHAAPHVNGGWDVTSHDGAVHVVTGELMTEAVGSLNPRALVGRHYLWRDGDNGNAVGVIGTVQDSVESDDARDRHRKRQVMGQPEQQQQAPPVSSGGTDDGEKIGSATGQTISGVTISGASLSGTVDLGSGGVATSGMSTISGASSGFTSVADDNSAVLSGVTISGGVSTDVGSGGEAVSGTTG